MSVPALRVRDLRAGYRTGLVLQGVDLDIGPGQIAALLGRNGVGKTTFVHTVIGILPVKTGSIQHNGVEVSGFPVHRVARSGIALVPQGRRIFSTLTVEENLEISSGHPTRRVDLGEVYDQLPQLAAARHRRGHQLSGGEQQMLAIARAIVSRSSLVLFDEPSEGLAPVVVSGITELLGGLRDEGLSALLVEQNLQMVFELADRVYIMEKGRIVYSDAIEAFRLDRAARDRYLGI